MSSDSIEINVLSSLHQIEAKVWDSCACPEDGRPVDPFTTHRFLLALEDSGSVGPGTGWQPQYLQARKDGNTIGVAPMYAKSHSQGEYIFDQNWAHAYEQAGGHYYPKLQIAVPHTPATGRRFLTKPDYEVQGMAALIQGASQLATENNLSSLHITFCTEEEADFSENFGLLKRTSQQFHWKNDGYNTFDDFLGSLSSRKRKNIKKERQAANAFGGTIQLLTGDDIKPEHWDAFWIFYQDTGARKWGTPYLTRAFFELAHATLRDDMLLILAEKDGEYIAGALNFIGRDTLYGRYWGCVEDHPCLHFEICYYRAIEYAISQGLSAVEAGAQGSHKLARGYLPYATHSSHFICSDSFRNAVSDFLEAERSAVTEDIEILTSYGPFKSSILDEQP